MTELPVFSLPPGGFEPDANPLGTASVTGSQASSVVTSGSRTPQCIRSSPPSSLRVCHNSMGALILEAVEPALGRRIIPTVPLAIFPQFVPEGLAGVLAAPIRMLHQSHGRFPPARPLVSASVTMSAVMRGCSDQPTTSRLNRSRTNADRASLHPSTDE